MTNKEFSDEFDVLYNSITSGQAPGLDEYEKSVFLTKAQDEIVKSYFNPRSNKTQEGFDGSERRQIDFSMITKSLSFYPVYTVTTVDVASDDFDVGDYNDPIETDSKEVLDSYLKGFTEKITIDKSLKYKGVHTVFYDEYHSTAMKVYECYTPFLDALFDSRKNTKSVGLPKDILMITNEYVEAIRNGSTVRLTILPVSYTEYNRLMSKPYKRPIKTQAWRLIDNNEGYNKAELIIGSNDTLSKYVLRYIKRPRAIRLVDFEDVTLDGGWEEQSCELDPITHPEILQRGVELAKAAYTGDLQSQIALGQASQTDIGAIQQPSR